MPKIEVDSIEIQILHGTTLLQACELVGKVPLWG